jgi:hypothetical protein
MSLAEKWQSSTMKTTASCQLQDLQVNNLTISEHAGGDNIVLSSFKYTYKC